MALNSLGPFFWRIVPYLQKCWWVRWVAFTVTIRHLQFSFAFASQSKTICWMVAGISRHQLIIKVWILEHTHWLREGYFLSSCWEDNNLLQKLCCCFFFVETYKQEQKNTVQYRTAWWHSSQTRFWDRWCNTRDHVGPHLGYDSNSPSNWPRDASWSWFWRVKCWSIGDMEWVTIITITLHPTQKKKIVETVRPIPLNDWQILVPGPIASFKRWALNVCTQFDILTVTWKDYMDMDLTFWYQVK